MKILITSPVPASSRRGNHVTSIRWKRQLRSLGHHVRVADDVDQRPCDLLVALHAHWGNGPLKRFRKSNPNGNTIVVLTGTDIYRKRLSDQTLSSIELADRLVVLQREATKRIPKRYRSKTHVIVQSAVAPRQTPEPVEGQFEITQVGHLRRVKDPFRAVYAARRLPKSSKIRLEQIGDPLTEAMERAATRLSKQNPRYRWTRSLPHAACLKRLARSRATIVSSRHEGGSAVICESIACGVPVLASRVDGNVGLLGESYPAFYEYGNAKQLAELMLKCETNPEFLSKVRSAILKLRPQVDPNREAKLIGVLLEQLA